MNSNKDFESRSRRSRRAHSRRRGAIAGIAALAALAAFAAVIAWRSPSPPPAAPAATGLIATPAPQPQPWTRTQIAALHADLVSSFAPALAGAHRWSFCVMAQSGRVLFGANARTAVKPASVEKLVIASTALDVLGPDYRYQTTVAAAAAPAAGGIVDGDLWLIGAGDPSLRTSDLASGARSLERDGVRRIDGGVAVDASAFKGPEINPLWNPADANEDYQVAVSAISLDEDTIEFDVHATTPGAPASIRQNPWSGSLHATGEVLTAPVTADPDVIVAALAVPNHFDLSGVVPVGQTDREWVPVHGMAHYAGAVFAQLLHEHGIVTVLPARTGAAPASHVVLWDHPSKPLRVLEHHMLYYSDNHYADQLLRTIGLVAEGTGDDAHGLAVERSDLHSRGISTPGMRLVDGSGLAEANRIASITLAQILTRALSLPAERGFYDLLPAGGKSGTVKGYDFTAARGRVRAKTGHLTGVSSLAGYVVSRRHGIVSFAFMIDGSPGDPDGAIVSAVDRIAQF